MNILFGSLLVSLIMGNIVRIQIAPHVALIPIDLVALCFLGIVLKEYDGLFKRIKESSVIKRGLAFILFGTISLCINILIKGYSLEQYSTALLYSVRFVAYLSIYVSLQSLTKELKEKYQKWLLLASFGILVTGWLQYLLYPDLRNLYYLGWDEHYFRMFGAFFDPNFAGAMYVLIMWYLISMKKHLKSFSYYAGIALSLGAIALTYSRSTYLMLIVSAFSYVFIQKKFKEMGISVVLFAVVFIAMPKQGFGEGVNLFRSASIIARVTEYQTAIGAIQKQPLVGVGYNAYGTVREDKASLFAEHAVAGLPNSWLFVMATTGIIGFLLYLNWWKAIVQIIMKSPAVAYLIPITLGLWVHGIFENTLFYPFILCFYLMLVAFGTPSQTKDHSPRSTK